MTEDDQWTREAENKILDLMAIKQDRHKANSNAMGYKLLHETAPFDRRELQRALVDGLLFPGETSLWVGEPGSLKIGADGLAGGGGGERLAMVRPQLRARRSGVRRARAGAP